MAFRLFLPLFIIFFAFLYIALLNPGYADFQYLPGRVVSVPFSALVMFSFLAGTLSLSLVWFFKGVGDVANDLANLFRRLKAARMEGDLVKARLMAGRGQLEKAMRTLERLVAKRPAHFDSQVLKGEVLRKMGRPKDALHAHSLALALQPADLGVIVQIKEDYLALGDREAAYRLLEQVRGRTPEDKRVLEEMRGLSVQLGEFHRAVAFQRELLALPADPVALKAEQVRMAEMYCLFSEQLLAEGRAESARENLEMALKLEPDFMPAAVLMADALRALSREGDAGAFLQKQFERTHSLVPLLKLAEMRDGERAALFAQARRTAPEQKAISLFMLAELVAGGDIAGAGRVMDEMADGFSGLPLFNIAKGIVELYAGGTPDENAVAPLRNALRVERERLAGYQCAACDAVEVAYFSQCPTCGHWNTATIAIEGYTKKTNSIG